MPEDKFNKFTERARKVLSLAQEEARRFNLSYIDTEHFLLALVREGDGVAAKVLSNMGVSLPKARAAVESIVGRRSEMVVGEIGLTPRARRVIEHAVDEARRLNHHYIGTEHLLLGLLRDPEGIGYQVLVNLGANPQVIRDRVFEVLFHATGQPYIPTIQEKTARFTEGAQKVLRLAHQEARQFNHSHVNSEHLLLGLLAEEEGVAANVLRELGVGYPEARQLVEDMARRGESTQTDDLSFSPRGRVVIDLAVSEARRMHDEQVGTEHLLLGVTRDGGGLATGVFRRLGVDPDIVRRRVFETLGKAELPVALEVFERFTDGARKVLSLAQEEARRFNRGYVGTEHLLIALVRKGDGIAAKVLSNMGVELPKVRAAVEFIAGHGNDTVSGEIWLAPRTRKSIELAVDESRRLNHHYVGTEHLLLGLLREGEGIAAGVLESMGVNLERVRHSVLQVASAISSAQPSESGRRAASSTSRSFSYQMASGPGLDRLKGLLEEPEGGYSSPFTHPINIASVLHDMTPQNREALVLREFGGLSTFDIGRILGLPRAAAKPVLFRARQEFRQLYQRARQRESARTRVEQVVQAVCSGCFTIELDEAAINIRPQSMRSSEAEASIRRVYHALVGWLDPESEAASEDDAASRPIELKSDDDAQWISVSLALLTAD